MMMKQHNNMNDFDWDKNHNDFDKDFDWDKYHDGCWDFPDYGCEYPYWWEYPYGCEYPYECEYPYLYEYEDHFGDMGGF